MQKACMCVLAISALVCFAHFGKEGQVNKVEVKSSKTYNIHNKHMGSEVH